VAGLDAWLSRYEQREYHERRVEAAPERALDAALRIPVEVDAVVRALFRLRRGVDARGKSLEQFFAPPWAEVLERTQSSFVARVDRRATRIVFDLRARPTNGGSTLSTETRVAGGGLPFRLYWLVVGPFSALIRRRWLIAAARRAAAESPNDR
jgi:hypothetical protein